MQDYDNDDVMVERVDAVHDKLVELANVLELQSMRLAVLANAFKDVGLTKVTCDMTEARADIEAARRELSEQAEALDSIVFNLKLREPEVHEGKNGLSGPVGVVEPPINDE